MELKGMERFANESTKEDEICAQLQGIILRHNEVSNWMDLELTSL